MVIRTIRETYRVRCVLKGSGGIRSYLCIREGGGTEQFLVMGAGNRKLSGVMLPYFMDLSQSGRVDGFEKCFVREGTAWVVFRYFEGTPFSEKAKSPFAERVQIGREFVEQIFAQNLPAYLQYEALHPANSIVSEKWGVRVNFLLFEPEKMQDELFPMVQKRMAEYFRTLFAEELEEDNLKELSEFVERMETADFTGEAALYRAFRGLDGELERAQESCGFERKGYLTRMWKKVFRRSKDIFQFFYCVLIGGLLGYLIYVCVAPETAPEERTLFQSIGTLELIHYEAPLLPDAEPGNAHEEGEPETQDANPEDDGVKNTEAPTEQETETVEDTEGTKDTEENGKGGTDLG